MDWWNNFTTWLDWNAVTAVATVAAALVAVLALRSAARDSRERSRPDVVAEYRVEPRVHKVLTFVVRNVGPTAAKDVRVVFEPPIEEASASQALRQFVRDRYAEE
ncbi:MAG: hypothetical protein J0H73_17295, partial [Salana multivorans]|nr:hypothetical protein [Salana multivorans]